MSDHVRWKAGFLVMDDEHIDMRVMTLQMLTEEGFEDIIPDLQVVYETDKIIVRMLEGITS